MNAKPKSAIPVLVTCALFITPFGVHATGEHEGRIASMRNSLHEAAEEARNGDRTKLHAITDNLEKRGSPYASNELLPDYIAFLKDADAQVQLLAVQALGRLRNPKSKDALCAYLKNKDFAAFKAKLNRHRQGSLSSTSEAEQLMWECSAISWAILTLGQVGDESVVPLLVSLREVVDWQLEWTGRPVEKALGELGAVKALVTVPPDADDSRISAAAGALHRIRDPNRAAELMAVARDHRARGPFRRAALSALGEIGSPSVPDFLVGAMNDPDNDQVLRRTAAVAAGKTGNRAAETALLRHALNRRSDIRPDAFTGLVLCRPERHLDPWFRTVMDPNEDRAFRERLATMNSHFPRNLLRDRRGQLYKGLHASDKSGRPLDKVRVQMWLIINRLYREEPNLTLSSKAPEATRDLRHPIGLRIMQSPPPLGYRERQARVEEVIERLVQVYQPEQREGPQR